MTITTSKQLKYIASLLLPLTLGACSTEDSSLSISTDLNGTWASYCTYNSGTGDYETTDYELYGTNASVLLSSYQDSGCTQVIDQTLYEGNVSQVGNVILGNGLNAYALAFSLNDQDNRNSIEYTSYFYATEHSLFEYTNPNNSSASFEFQRI